MVALDPSLLLKLSVLARAGFNTVWNGTFEGEAGKAVDTATWNIITKSAPLFPLPVSPFSPWSNHS